MENWWKSFPFEPSFELKDSRFISMAPLRLPQHVSHCFKQKISFSFHTVFHSMIWTLSFGFSILMKQRTKCTSWKLKKGGYLSIEHKPPVAVSSYIKLWTMKSTLMPFVHKRFVAALNTRIFKVLIVKLDEFLWWWLKPLTKWKGYLKIMSHNERRKEFWW